MAKSSKEPLVPISFWAVGRHPQTTQVAIKLNNLPPILMSVENAREIAAALNAEIHAISHMPAVEASLPTRSVRGPRK